MNRYIALEGIEGAGKTTVQTALRERLEAAGHEVVGVREPGGTRLGVRLRRILLYGEELEPWTEALLFAADRAHLVSSTIRPALERGAWVISDRSVYSSLAYQGAGRGLGLDAVRSVNESGLSGLWPGLVVLLRVEPGTGLSRQVEADSKGIRVIRQEVLPIGTKPDPGFSQAELALSATDRIGLGGERFQSLVAEAFDELARREPERFAVVDAERPLEEVTEAVWAAVEAAL